MNIIEEKKLMLIAELFKNFSDIIIKNKLIEFRKEKPVYYLKKYIEENLNNPIDIKNATEYIGRSASFVTHKFKEIYGKSFHKYLIHARIEQAKNLLQKHSISETFHLCGFTDRYHFSKVFKKIEGITPHQYQLLINK
ncbi:protein containing Helix-turn-helix, AraC domain [sediment metagenome]|uniref:Protein containing Helix-turn-helix, AraC domain n=1 Tax=sediment metagenome TaxID=749907 RepID=D9PHG4_9ZZZZ